MGGNKKGDISLNLETVIELILILVVFIGLLVYVYSLYKDTFFEKSFMARDLAILGNSVQSVPGNVYFHYAPPIPIEKYHFSFTDNLAVITEQGYSKVFYPFFYNDFHLRNAQWIEGKSDFYISDYSNHFIVSDRALVGLKTKVAVAEEAVIKKIVMEQKQPLLECDDITSTIEISSIVLNAGAGDKEELEGKTNVQGTQIESEITFNTVEALYNALYDALLSDALGVLNIYNIIRTRGALETDTDFTYLDRINKIPADASLILSIHAGEEQDDAINGINALIRANDEQSNKLACIVLSKLYAAFPQLEKPPEIIIAAEEDEKLLYLNKEGINKNSLSIKLELGNINYPNNPLYFRTDKVVKALNDAIEGYIKGVLKQNN